MVLNGKDSRILCSSCQHDAANYEIMTLPCSNVVCLNCFDAMFESDLSCKACGARHDPADFLSVGSADSLRRSVQELQKSQAEFTSGIRNVQMSIRDYCERLRLEVHAQTENIVENLNRINRKLIKEIDDYELGLLGQFKNRSSATFNLRKNWDRLLADVGQFNLKWLSYLEQTKIDEKEIDQALERAKELKKVLQTEQDNMEKVTFGNEILIFEANELLPKNHNPIGELKYFELEDDDEDNANDEKDPVENINVTTDDNISADKNSVEATKTLEPYKVLRGHTNQVFSLAVLPDGNLASGSSDLTIKLWNIETSNWFKTLSGHSDLVSSLLVLPDGKLASGSHDLTINIWNLSDYSLVRTLRGHEGAVKSLLSLPDEFMASGSDDRTLRIWAKEGYLVNTLKGHEYGVISLAFVPSSQLIASGSYNQILFWSLDEGVQVKSLTGFKCWVWSLVALPNESLASACDDKTIKIWSVKDERLLRLLQGHTHYVVSLAPLLNGYLASGSLDRTIKVWDLATGSSIRTFEGHDDTVWALALMNNGSLASGSGDETIKIWNLNLHN